MPELELEMEIRSPAARVWAAVVDIERYPACMDNVQDVRIVGPRSATRRRSAWAVLLKGCVLQWEEEEHLDPDRLVMEFHQLSGDMERFDGAWILEARAPRLTHVSLKVSFEIGIPLLAEMLNPVAQRSLRENCTDMLLGVEREALAA
jgi:ribosome-associated toxin RatA of RatAB toxin-antitoxin module